jgi:hypothetical protein
MFRKASDAPAFQKKSIFSVFTRLPYFHPTRLYSSLLLRERKIGAMPNILDGFLKEQLISKAMGKSSSSDSRN